MKFFRKNLRYFTLALFLLTNGIIVTEAALPGGTSGARSSLISLFLSVFFNKTLPAPEAKDEVFVTGMALKNHEDKYFEAENHYYIPLGITRRVTPVIYPSNATDKGVSYKSSNETVLAVYPGGYLEARKLGENVLVTVTPAKAEYAFSIYVTVTNKVAPPVFTAELKQPTIAEHTTTTLSLNLTERELREYDPYKLEYKSEDESIAVINNYGVVKGISRGETYVKIKGHPERYKITITDALGPEVLPSLISLDLPSHGYVYDHTPLDYDFDVPGISDDSVTIVSSAPEIARIIEKEDGYYVEGTKVSGDAKITVYLNSDFNVFAEQNITMVNVLPSGLSLESSKTEVNVGATLTITPKFSHNVAGFLPTLAVTDQRVTYTTSDKSVATVSAGNLSGAVVGKKAGESVTITATSVADPTISASITIKITTPPFINDNNFKDFQGFIRKALGHFMLFFVDGFFGFWTFYLFLKAKTPNKKLFLGTALSLLTGLIMAALSEIIQIFIPLRSASVFDVLLDFSGYLLVTLILLLIVYLYNRKKAKENQLLEEHKTIEEDKIID